MDNNSGINFWRELWVSLAVSLGVLLFFLLCVAAVFSAHSQPQPQPHSAPATVLPVAKTRLDERPVLVLDAGHGGEDPGALSADGLIYEATKNRAVAALLFEMLAAHEDELRVVKSYAEDGFTSLMGRARVAVDNQADLLLSLHLNASYGENEHGFSVYPAPPGRTHHTESLRFAQLLADTVEQGGNELLGSGIWYAYYPRVPSGGFGSVLIDSADADLSNPRPEEGFTVVEHAGCPAVLVEQWFITSESDMARFGSPAGLERMAEYLYQTICAYFNLTAREIGDL